MELRHLRYFVAVAEEQSFTGAAKRLHMSQPPLSSQIRALEEELGVVLFDRSQRGVRLTDAGRTLLDEARGVLVGVEQATRAVRRVGTGTVGRLAIGFVPSASNRTLPPILRRFGAAFPDVELFLREMRPDALLEALRRSRIDVAFLYGPFEDALLAHATVAEEALVVALPDGHPLARGARVDVRALRDEPFILPARHGMPGLHARVLELCERAGFVPRAVQKDVWLMQTVLGLVAARVGVAVVPDSVEDLRRTGVVYRTPRGRALRVELAVAWRRDDRSPLLARFLACAREDTAQEAPSMLPGSVPTLTP